MTLLPGSEDSPFHQTFVALDLETTGLDRQHDEIIEVGAVRFRGDEVLDTFTSVVNPHRELSPFIQRLTNISQADVDAGPPFAMVAPQIKAFVGDAPLVGHNVAFDVAFLARQGIQFAAPAFDSWDLATVLMPTSVTSLATLAAHFGISHVHAHRALADAGATHLVFVALLKLGLALDPAILAELHRLATVSQWPVRHLLRGLEAEAARRGAVTSRLGLGGLDLAELQQRLGATRHRGRRFADAEPMAGEDLDALLAEQGPLAQTLRDYEPREEQAAMLRAVASALENDERLMVEAGTGVGKSLAYLLPAAIYALKNNARVVVSTNTINLQEQLMDKDIPTVVETLERAGEVTPGGLRFTSLKGRANYLCLRRWSRLRSSETLSVDEARLLAKLLVWLQETRTGDRAELHLTPQESSIWERLSAQGSRECPVPGGGACCLLAARERAAAADLVVVNHSLLLSDLQRGGGLLPDYRQLIVDEAHHLESETTRQFGFRVTFEGLEEALNALAGPRGLAQEAVLAYRASSASEARRQRTVETVQELVDRVGVARRSDGELFAALARFLDAHAQGGDGVRSQLLVTQGIRTQPDWSDLELVAEKVHNALGDAAKGVADVYNSLDGLEQHDLVNYRDLRMELLSQTDALREVQGHLGRFFLHPEAETVYWAEGSVQTGLAVNGAPLRVGEILRERLFDAKESVVLTSATLSVAGSVGPMEERLGLEEAEELLLGSPFDYSRAALVCVPQDMPEPSNAAYGRALAQAVAGLAQAAGGRTMALFTSHSSLRAARAAVRGDLESEGIQVLAQGVDGAPRQLLEQFMRWPRSVLLGTASFWEGVDLAGAALQVLVLARLPFEVPTEPIFAARSELYEAPFRDYAVPQAVLRFRQGFGRLIRTKSDRGVVVVLDRRITSRSYGKLFLDSLPQCQVSRGRLTELPATVRDWLRR